MRIKPYSRRRENDHSPLKFTWETLEKAVWYLMDEIEKRVIEAQNDD